MLDELLELTVGKVRELLAYADADMDFQYWVDNCLDEDDFPKEEEEDWEDDYDEEEDDYGEPDDEEDDIVLTPSEEELARQIANDIASQAYSLSAIDGAYSEEFVRRVQQLL